MKIIVSNIQRFSLHDGPGIRTTVFFKGCNLKCPWCSNPENMNFEIEKYIDGNEEKYYGYEIELEDLEKEIIKDKAFYETGGGVTFSGGEPLLQFDKIESLLKNLKEKNINICIETALSVKEELVEIAIKYVDEFIIDIKILDKDNVNKINGNVKLYESNIKKVFESGKRVIFRIPLAKKYIATEKNIKLILDFLKQYKPDKVEIFKIHNLGEKKYKTLNRKMTNIENISEEDIEKIKNKIEDLGIKTEICKI